MTEREIADAYALLDDMVVRVDHAVEKGVSPLRVALIECRTKQDQVGDLVVRANRDLAMARAEGRRLRALIEVSPLSDVDALKSELRGIEDQEDGLKYLLVAAKVRKENLRATAADIKALMQAWEEQIRLGEIQPPDLGRQLRESTVQMFGDDDHLDRLIAGRLGDGGKA